MVSYWDLELIDVGLLAKMDQWMGVFRRENLQLQPGDMAQAERFLANIPFNQFWENWPLILFKGLENPALFNTLR